MLVYAGYVHLRLFDHIQDINKGNSLENLMNSFNISFPLSLDELQGTKIIYHKP